MNDGKLSQEYAQILRKFRRNMGIKRSDGGLKRKLRTFVAGKRCYYTVRIDVNAGTYTLDTTILPADQKHVRHSEFIRLVGGTIRPKDPSNAWIRIRDQDGNDLNSYASYHNEGIDAGIYYNYWKSRSMRDFKAAIAKSITSTGGMLIPLAIGGVLVVAIIVMKVMGVF